MYVILPGVVDLGLGDLADLDDAALADGARTWARAENVAAAHKMAVLAQWFGRRTGLDSAAEREHWWIDPHWAVATEIGVALNVTGVALNVTGGLACQLLHRAVALQDRLPRVVAPFSRR